MVIHTCPRTGHVRRFRNGRALKRWLREQAERYVPTVAEDTKAFASVMPGVGRTNEHTATLTRTKTGGKKLSGPRRCKPWQGVDRGWRHDTVSDIYDVHNHQPKSLYE